MDHWSSRSPRAGIKPDSLAISSPTCKRTKDSVIFWENSAGVELSTRKNAPGPMAVNVPA